MESSDKDQIQKNITEVQTFPVQFALGEKQENLTIKTNTTSKPSKEKIITQAIQFHLKGNIPEAAKLYQYCINQGLKDHRVFSNYGAILQGLGKLQEAELLLRKAIELKPDYAEAHSNLGNILRDLDKLKEAEFLYRKAIELKPDYAEAHANLGVLLSDLGKLQDAEISYRKAIKVNPGLAEAHLNLGSILIDNGKLKEAELSTRKAIELNPKFAMGHYLLSMIYSKENLYSKAYKEIKLAFKYDSANHLIQGELTRIKFIIGTHNEKESSINGI